MMAEERQRICGKCDPGKFTKEKNCSSPLFLAFERASNKKIVIVWSQCDVYRDWAEKRQKLRESKSKNKNGFQG